MSKKRVLSGIQPSGALHIGNYLGAIKNWVASQDEFDNFFCIVDLHAITVPQDPKELKKNIRDLAAIFFASGIDPQKSTVFVQSHVSAHSELAWILNCFIPMGAMERMTQFKEKSLKQKDFISVGLFDYPALMAADILLYDADFVPVGEDQRQHIELTRDVAERINSKYGEVLKVPAPAIHKVAARVMGLDDPTKKMSKSESNPNHAVFLLDEPDVIRTKIAKATTDSEKTIVFDENRPAIYNLLEIYQAFSGKSSQEIESHFAGKSYVDFKSELAELIIEKLAPIQEKYKVLVENPQKLEEMLEEGARKAKEVADKTLRRVQEKVGLG